MKISRLLPFATALVIFGAAPRTVFAQDDPVFDARGVHPNRDYFSALPFEHIDTATGGIVLTFTDLVLPGNAGRGLKFQRTYNSKSGLWTFGIAGVVLRVASVWPIGDLVTDQNPFLYTVDGGAQEAATPLYHFPLDPVESRRVMMTDRLWKYYRSSRILWTPDGSVSEYDAQGRLTEMRDAFGNRLTLTWIVRPQPEDSEVQVFQHLSANQVRLITLTFPYTEGGIRYGTPTGVPKTMAFDGRTWTFTGVPLAAVTPPEGTGAPWRYQYGNPTVVITPHGGEIHYSTVTKTFPTGRVPGENVSTEVISERKMVDRGGAVLGTWVYDFDMDNVVGAKRTTMTFTRPDNSQVVTTWNYDWWRDDVLPAPNPNNNAIGNYPGRTYVLASRSVDDNGRRLETEELKYTYVPIPSANAPDALPELKTRTITRDGQATTYTTTFTYSPDNFGDFHTPSRVDETGQRSRTTTRTFQHSANAPHDAPYLVGLVASEMTTVDGQSVTSSWIYDNATGFRTSETVGGITTTFASDGRGNVASVTKANGKVTSFTYDWGQIESTTTPEYVISRDISPDGTLASETRGGRTTIYSYDDLGRLRRVDPPLGADTVIAYNDPDHTVTATREALPTRVSDMKTTLDGFGRPISTVDKTGFETRTTYDADGRVSYRSLPFTAADVGTTTTYDGLGRVTREQHSDNTVRTFLYEGNLVTARDENNRPTVLTRKAFGDPDDVVISGTLDADGKPWAYAYDALGQLTSMSGPDGVTRTWTYDPAKPALLTTERHPELGPANEPSGAITYVEYDAAGVLKKKRDANGAEFVYEYDGNDRLKKITAGTSVTTITYEPGTDNRQSVSVDGVSTLFAYDDAGRMVQRTDTVDGKPFATKFAYDGNDNVIQVTYPSGRKIGYEYGHENRLIRVFNAHTDATYASEFDYHPSGAPLRFTSGNGLVTTMTYDDNRYWIKTIAAGLPASAAELQLGYTNYDGVGNVRTITEPNFGTQTFTYDLVDRLDSAAGPYGTSDFAYDLHGNRTGSLFTYTSGKPFRLQAYDSLPMSYDNNGNMTTRSSDTFAYTADNLVKTATIGGVPTNYAYDADAWRLKKVVGNGAPTYYVRGPNGQLLTEWTNTTPTATVRDYIYAGSRLIAVIKADTPPK